MQKLRRSAIFLLLLLLAADCFAQSEALKSVVNNLAFYRQKKDIKYLSNAKKSVDSLFTTHSDSVNLQKNVYKALVYSSILYTDSLNKLNQPASFYTQTTQLVDQLLAQKKSYRYQPELNYCKRCLANVFIRQGFLSLQKANYTTAIAHFQSAKQYAPDFKPVDAYIAYSNSKAGNFQTAARYYTDLVNSDSVKVSYVQSAAAIYRSSGDTATALGIIKNGRKLFPHDRSLLLDEANIYNNRKDYHALAALIPALMEVNSNNADIAFVAANCYDHLNDYDKAASLYLSAIELNSSAFEPVFDLGLLYFKQSELKNQKDRAAELKRAIQWLQRANEIAPGNINNIKALQMAYARAGDTEQLININNQLKQFTN